LHWFNIQAFFAEADRILKPDGILAIWSYARCTVMPECDDVIEKVFAEVEPFWPPERYIVENGYRDIVLPFPEIPVGHFEMVVQWTAAEMLNYMRTWSATQRYRRQHDADPVALYEQALCDCWGTGSRKVAWPMTVRAGRKPAP